MADENNDGKVLDKSNIIPPSRDLPEHLETGTGDGISFPVEHRGVPRLRTLSARPALMKEPLDPNTEHRTANPREPIPQTPWGAVDRTDEMSKREEKVVKPGETAG